MIYKQLHVKMEDSSMEEFFGWDILETSRDNFMKFGGNNELHMVTIQLKFGQNRISTKKVTGIGI